MCLQKDTEHLVAYNPITWSKTFSWFGGQVLVHLLHCSPPRNPISGLPTYSTVVGFGSSPCWSQLVQYYPDTDTSWPCELRTRKQMVETSLALRRRSVAMGSLDVFT